MVRLVPPQVQCRIFTFKEGLLSAVAHLRVARLDGELSLHGRLRPLTVALSHGRPAWTAEASIHQPDFGVKPFTAMLGTLRISADVRVRVTAMLPE
jgi:hypothetical protein